MNLLANLGEFSILAFTLVLFGAQMVAYEFGGWFGRRHATRGVSDLESVGLVVSGMLGLLAFLLALTLSFSSTRFQERQADTLADANAISTAWLRAKTIGNPSSREIARLLEEYARQQKAFVNAPRSGGEDAVIGKRISALQTEIWVHMAAITRERQDPVVVALMIGLNETFDYGSVVRFDLEVRPPSQGVWLLLGLALLSIATLGYRLGLKGEMYRILATLLIAMWTMVIVIILDLGAARVGAIRTSTAPYDWTLQSFAHGVPTLTPSGASAK